MASGRPSSFLYFMNIDTILTPRRPAMKRIMHRFLSVILLLSLLSACVVVKVNLTSEAQPLEEQVIAGNGKDKILLMEITGVITTEESTTSLGISRQPGMVAVLREQLDRARKDRNVKAMVLRINSP